jgi:putative oxidoreductase
MTTNVSTHIPVRTTSTGTHEWLRYLVPLGRAFFVAIFIASGFSHFSRESIDYAAGAGVPLANVLVPIAGILALLGGLSVLLGYHARIGAWLLVAFLVPVTLMMHRFWDVADPMMGRIQFVMFMKNLSILGGALLIAYFGSGPVSVDNALAERSSHTTRSVVP